VIQVEAILAEDFRGIRRLDLRPACRSFVVWGPNGSGKSGVVDAIDFALTGTIARLSGIGTGAVSVLRHGPHVLQRNNAEAAKVSLTIRDTVSGQTGVLTRCVKTASTFTLVPDTPQLRAAVEQARQHPELTLSRREIIKYILTEPSARAQAIQALLKLDRVDQVRKLLVAARNKAATESAAAARELATAEDSMSRHLGLTSLSAVSDIMREVNQRRAVLGLQAIDRVGADTNLRAGVEAAAGSSGFNKVSATLDVQALAAGIANPDRVRAAAAQLTAGLHELSADPVIMSALRHRALVTMGLDLLAEAACPLCDLRWEDIEELRAHLQEKLGRSEAAASLERRILEAGSALRAALQSLADLAQGAQPWAASFGDSELPHRLRSWSQDLAELSGRLHTIDGAAEELPRISVDVLSVPVGIVDGLTALQSALEAKPDQSATENARTFLTVAQERWARVGVAQSADSKAVGTQKTANSIYDNYCAAADEALTNLYKTVESDFSGYYRQINDDDESSFTAKLEPSAGKLDFKVDFYGIDMFPPTAYHSEGHQDGMGVCLYLALAKQMLAEDFRFAVLDDVVMSVDSHHRKQFCRLLKETFPNVQFIITTHDEVWARQMQSSGLVGRKSQARFHGWSVNEGPVYEQGGDVWERIGLDLGNDDVASAAHKLRRYLEAAAGDIAESLRAPVPYRPDSSYDLGEFLAAVKGRHGELLKKAAASANSWKNPQAVQQVQDLKGQRAKVIPLQEDESWVINKLVHNNDRAPMVVSDFDPVVDASRRFLDLFTCSYPDCESWIYVVGYPGNEESLRCSCGAYNLNLQVK
jgi:hypothetical protein